MTTKQASLTNKLEQSLHPKLIELLNVANLTTSIIASFEQTLRINQTLNKQLNAYFSNPDQYKNIIPIFIYNERSQDIATILANKYQMPPEPGECGSILSYARAHGKNEDFLYSDCYGQLSCSSCAVEVLAGTVENPIPREEEYDMLDIDEDRPPTEKTRLSCQACVGSTPLVLKIRA